jgi:3-hydroxyacyl-CoA dehydrogenase/enoyl-CoA hydratase/3-hydroxybutyryl-CoA epimerase
MLQEGIPPAVIENAGMRAGMGIGPLQLADELSLELVLRYENQAAEHYGSKYVQHPAVAVLQYMLDEARRPGRQKGAGFYEWRSEVPVLWRGIEERFPSDASRVELFGQIIERLLFAQCIEAIWCLQEKVIGTVEEANVGSIYGWGFPAFKGGVMQCIYSFGLEQFITHCRALEGAHGQRFKVPRWLKRMAESIS